MSDKPYSISKAFNECSNGTLTGLERETNLTALRAFERMEVTDKRVTSGLIGELIVPWEVFMTGQRQLVATGSPLIGTWTTGYSDLQTWSMVLKSGATVLRNLKANAVVWEVGELPVPNWLGEIGQALPASPVFGGVTTKPWPAFRHDQAIGEFDPGQPALRPEHLLGLSWTHFIERSVSTIRSNGPFTKRNVFTDTGRSAGSNARSDLSYTNVPASRPTRNPSSVELARRTRPPLSPRSCAIRTFLNSRGS